MPQLSVSLRAVLCAAALVAVGIAIPSMANADGHCMYKKLSPGARQWYAACRMPASAKSCDEWAMSPGVSETKFADGDCPASGTVGACVVRGVTQYYYKMSKAAAAEGCEHAKGNWQPDSTPGTKP